MNEAITALRARLQAAGEDYELLEALTPQRARFRFIGSFSGREVIWDTTLVALGCVGVKQYLEIGAATGEQRPIEVGLLVDELGTAAIQKTIIMIRNYRRLHEGRHEYAGPAK